MKTESYEARSKNGRPVMAFDDKNRAIEFAKSRGLPLFCRTVIVEEVKL